MFFSFVKEILQKKFAKSWHKNWLNLQKIKTQNIIFALAMFKLCLANVTFQQSLYFKTAHSGQTTAQQASPNWTTHHFLLSAHALQDHQNKHMLFTIISVREMFPDLQR